MRYSSFPNTLPESLIQGCGNVTEALDIGPICLPIKLKQIRRTLTNFGV